MNEEHMELETLLEPYPVKYTFDNPPPKDRCGALSFNCRNPECTFRFPDDDRESKICEGCGTMRGLCGSFPSKSGHNNSMRCGKHGGLNPSGIQHHNFKGRSLSSNLPTRLSQLAGLTNRDNRKEFLNFMDDIEVLDIRKMDLLRRLDESGSAEKWKEMADHMRNYRKHQKSFQNGKTASGRKMLSEIDAMETVIVQGNRESYIWKEYGEISEQTRKLRESQLKKDEKEADVITTADAREIITGFLNIIRTRVSDEKLRSAIQNDISQMIMVPK